MMTNDMGKNMGVRCEVSSCMYHTRDCGCSAEKISVGPTDATCCNETCCATYQQR